MPSEDRDSDSRQCESCKHLGFGLRCAAFPDGIPDEILSGTHDHTKPFDGDHGIQYEAREYA